jgi:hypothetical protein
MTVAPLLRAGALVPVATLTIGPSCTSTCDGFVNLPVRLLKATTSSNRMGFAT